jgi:hypothetical protein
MNKSGNKFIIAISALVFGHIGLAFSFFLLMSEDVAFSFIPYVLPLAGALFGYAFAIFNLWLFRSEAPPLSPQREQG